MSQILFYNVWRTQTPENRARLIALMKEKTRIFESKPGFLSLLVSECTEDGRVIAATRWASLDAFDQAVTNNAEAHAGREEMAAYGTPEPGLFREAFNIESQADLNALRAAAASRWASLGFDTRIANVNGVSLEISEAGQGELVVLLHGYPQSGEIWRGIAPGLARSHRVVVADLRGMGLSQVAPDGYDLANVAEDIHQLVAGLGYQRVKVMGHDWGAAVGAVYALRYRDEVTRLVFIESALAGCGFETLWNFATPNPVFSFIPLLLMGDGNSDIDITAELLRGRETAYLRHLWTTFTGDKIAVPFESWAPYVAAMERPGIAASSASYYRSVYESAEQARALVTQKLELPVLAIAGAKGIGAFHKTLVEAFARNLYADLILDGGGHFLPEERPQEVLTAAIPYLA
ncbi:MAG: alpha/beta fold hydrolase [Blastocatellia bacterium]|nr:alpha/beta fold hydrolase [Blastocatellia bacterium]